MRAVSFSKTVVSVEEEGVISTPSSFAFFRAAMEVRRKREIVGG